MVNILPVEVYVDFDLDGILSQLGLDVSELDGMSSKTVLSGEPTSRNASMAVSQVDTGSLSEMQVLPPYSLSVYRLGR